MPYMGGQIILRRTRGEVTAQVRRGRKGELIVNTENSLLIPFAIVEVLVTALLMTLTYCFRFDPTIRFNSDMVDYSRVSITCDKFRLNYQLSRSYFDYGNPEDSDLQGLELQYQLPEWTFFLCCLLVPIPIICAVEGIRAWFPGKKSKEVVAYGYAIPQCARRILRITCAYVVGGCLIGIFISIFKFNITSPRPHFMSVCFNSSKTLPASCNGSNFFWSPDIECDPDVDPQQIVEAMKSFPSYHAGVALYCGTYISAYVALAARIRSFHSGSLLVLLSLAVMTLIGATHRLGSGHSFPIDIIVGSLLGFSFALFVVCMTMNKFKERRWRIKIVDPVPHNEDKMLPVKALNHVPPYTAKPEPELISEPTSSASDFSSDEDDIEDYGAIMRNIDDANNTIIIPRINANTRQPEQAVNRNVTSIFASGLNNVSGSVTSRSTVGQNGMPQWNSFRNRYNIDKMEPLPIKDSFRSENSGPVMKLRPLKPQESFAYRNSAFEDVSQM